MYVVADVEWVENKVGKRSPTQISAARVDEKWNEIEQYTSCIRPMDASFHDWEHVAYTGMSPAEFLYARSCYAVWEEFNHWVGTDTICWWFRASEELYRLINKVVLKNKKAVACVILSEYISAHLAGQPSARGNPYKLARVRNIGVPDAEHYSRNDVKAVLNLLKGISFPQETLLAPPRKAEMTLSYPQNVAFSYLYDTETKLIHRKGCSQIPENAITLGYSNLVIAMRKGYKPCACVKTDLRLAKRARVIDEIERTQYAYIYAEHGMIFHRHDCGLLHNAIHILGANKYQTILSKGLVPCKVCRPTPDVPPRVNYSERRTDHVASQTPVALAPMKRVKVKKATLIPMDGLKRSVRTAVKRLQQSQEERHFGALDPDMTGQERSDLYTLTQPRYGFFVAAGYQNFHTRNCSRLYGKSNLRGFDTFAHAKRAGYTPCKHCKPTPKQDVVVSIPITSTRRLGESISDLVALCVQYGYKHRATKGEFALETPVGKWIIHTDSVPVTLDHINLVKQRNIDEYHRQHRIFLSMLDAVKYIHRHDSALLAGAKCS